MEQDIYKRRVAFIKLLVVAVVIFLLAFVAYQFINSRRFHAVSTNPSINSVAAISPFFKINFNKSLSSNSISVSSSYSVAKSYKVEGKTLVVTLTSPMTAGYNYYIKVNSISDNNGHRLVNKTFSFVPKDVAWKSLSKDQQQALLQTQAVHPKTKNDVTFQGFDALVNNGMTTAQLDTLEQAFFSFNDDTKTVSASSVVATPHDRNSASTMDSIQFTVKVGSKTYNATVSYTALGVDAHLLLYNPQGGSLVFDSYSEAADRE